MEIVQRIDGQNGVIMSDAELLLLFNYVNITPDRDIIEKFDNSSVEDHSSEAFSSLRESLGTEVGCNPVTGHMYDVLDNHFRNEVD